MTGINFWSRFCGSSSWHDPDADALVLLDRAMYHILMTLAFPALTVVLHYWVSTVIWECTFLATVTAAT